MGIQEHDHHAAVIEALRRYQLARAGFVFHSRNGRDALALSYLAQGRAIRDDLFILRALLNKDDCSTYVLTEQEHAALDAVYAAELKHWQDLAQDAATPTLALAV